MTPDEEARAALMNVWSDGYQCAVDNLRALSRGLDGSKKAQETLEKIALMLEKSAPRKEG